MRTIALEEHFLADGFRETMLRTAARSADSLPPTITAERQVKLGDLGSVRLQDMDAAGIDLQVVSDIGSIIAPRPGDEGVQLARAANDQLAASIMAHPDRFAGFATLPMMTPTAADDELARAVTVLGLKGPMIHGMMSGRFLDDPAFLPVLERAAALNVPIYLHPALPPDPVRAAYYANLDPTIGFFLATSGWGWHSEVGLHVLRLVLAGVFDRLPGLQIIIGHMGEMIPYMLARIDEQITPAARHLELPVPAYFLRNVYITTSGFFTDPPLLLALQVVGADRIMFSVDYPFSTNEQGRAFLDHAAISPADKEKISHLNAERLLGIKQAPAQQRGS